MPRHAIAIRAAVASLVAIGGAPPVGAQAHGPTAPGGTEKCFGVAKAGQNDCGTAKHACATMARSYRDPEEWKLAPKETCRKLGGRLEPPEKGPTRYPLRTRASGDASRDDSSSRSWLRVKRRCVTSAPKNIPHVHSTKIRSLRPNVGICAR